MPYLTCEKCGGYYKLQEEESPEDFDRCQCGGKLNYVESIRKESNKGKNHVKCNICGHEQKKALICSKCGSSLRRITNHRNIGTVNYRNRVGYRNDFERDMDDDLLDRLKWNGVTSGVVFYIVAYIAFIIISFLIPLIFGGIMQSVYMGNIAQSGTSNADVSGLFGIASIIGLILSIIRFLIPIASGYWAVSKITTNDYLTGMINGGAVGIVVGIIFGILGMVFTWLFSGSYGQTADFVITFSVITALITGIITTGIFTAAGGVIAVYLRRNTSYVL